MNEQLVLQQQILSDDGSVRGTRMVLSWAKSKGDSGESRSRTGFQLARVLNNWKLIFPAPVISCQ